MKPSKKSSPHDADSTTGRATSSPANSETASQLVVVRDSDVGEPLDGYEGTRNVGQDDNAPAVFLSATLLGEISKPRSRHDSPSPSPSDSPQLPALPL